MLRRLSTVCTVQYSVLSAGSVNWSSKRSEEYPNIKDTSFAAFPGIEQSSATYSSVVKQQLFKWVCRPSKCAPRSPILGLFFRVHGVFVIIRP
jgi:hypothetical protein